MAVPETRPRVPFGFAAAILPRAPPSAIGGWIFRAASADCCSRSSGAAWCGRPDRVSPISAAYCGRRRPMVLALFTLFAAISLVLIYWGVAHLINRSVFTLCGQASACATVRCPGPLVDCTLMREDIVSVCVASSRTRRGPTCWLEATLVGDRHIRLSHKVHNRADARFNYIAAGIEQCSKTPHAALSRTRSGPSFAQASAPSRSLVVHRTAMRVRGCGSRWSPRSGVCRRGRAGDSPPRSHFLDPDCGSAHRHRTGRTVDHRTSDGDALTLAARKLPGEQSARASCQTLASSSVPRLVFAAAAGQGGDPDVLHRRELREETVLLKTRPTCLERYCCRASAPFRALAGVHASLAGSRLLPARRSS